MKIKRYINMTLILVLVGGLIYSCSDDISPVNKGGDVDQEKEVFLSLGLNIPKQGNEKAAGGIDGDLKNAESKIYSLDVLIFRSSDQERPGVLDKPMTSIARVVDPLDGKTYKVIDEIKNIPLTAGKRDIYVIANAPANYFASVTKVSELEAKLEDLATQGQFDYPGSVTPPTEELPIGGIKPSDRSTNLTMCKVLKNIKIENAYTHHYLGYVGNNGRPSGITEGGVVNGVNNTFEVERLVARVAIKKITFQLPASLTFEAGFPTSDYTYQLDSVFMMNVKNKSRFPAEYQTNLLGEFAHGCKTGYNFLKKPGYLAKVSPTSTQADYLTEPIFTRNYNIATNATTLWFYTFENNEGTTYPTYLIIGVRYNFSSTKEVGKTKTVKYYYPVVINPPKAGKTADHDYIKRNHQYFLEINIKSLSKSFADAPSTLKSLDSMDESVIEVTETVGRNLFPWTGSTYK